MNIMNVTEISLSKLAPNEGQLSGLPANPRTIKNEKFNALKNDIIQYPELLNLRGLMVYPLDDDKYIIIGGNMRYRALLDLNYKSAPCIIIPKETTIEQLKAYTILDNNGFGQWDWDMLANEWDYSSLLDWGVDLPIKTDDAEKIQKDLSDDINLEFRIEINCADEQQQEALYNELTERGIECRILTL